MIAGDLASLEGAVSMWCWALHWRVSWRVQSGDQLDVTVPRLTVTPLGVFPRSKRLLVTGLFEVGAQPDGYQAYVSLATGQKLLGERGRVDGLQIKTSDLFSAPADHARLWRRRCLQTTRSLTGARPRAPCFVRSSWKK